MNRRRVLRAVSAAMLVCSLLFYEQSARSQMVATASSGDFIIFDPTGSTFTVPSGITPSGVITGYYTDANGVTHGFLRNPTGVITTFDPPGSKYTQPTAINPAGVIVGSYCPTLPCFASFTGFIRSPDGAFTTFGPPGYRINPSIFNPGGPPPSINPAGLIAGTYYVPPSSIQHGFLRTPDGDFTTVDVPGSPYTEVINMNQPGALTGVYCDAVSCEHGFLQAPDGTITKFDNPQGGNAINPRGAIVGISCDASGCHGVVRDPNGTFTEFDPPGSTYTSPFAITPAGEITGYYCDAIACHGFLRAKDGTITPFDPPGSTFTAGFEITPAGLIIGSYLDSNGAAHGFLFFPAQ